MVRAQQTLHNSNKITQLPLYLRHCSQDGLNIPPIPHPTVIEDEEGMRATYFQHKVHRSPSGPHIIPLEVPIP